jgi:hypothetical protein
VTWIGSPQRFGTNMASSQSSLPRRLEGGEAAAEQWTWQRSEMPDAIGRLIAETQASGE